MNRLLIITGASRGIGFATANLFAQHGWNILNISRTPYPGNNAINICCDLSKITQDDKQITDFINSIENAQQICLVHNAALFFNDNVKQPDLLQLSSALYISIIAPAILNQIIIPKMADTSSIIYIGSTLSEKAIPNAATYATTKHATVGLMRATTQDLAFNGIHSCCICPGFTDTNMVANRIDHFAASEAFKNFAKSKVGANRLIAPEEIAKLIYFCALNPVLNGAVLHANLGQLES